MIEVEPVRNRKLIDENLPDAPVIPEIENPVVTVSDLNLHYGETQALFDIEMRVSEHEVTAFIGPSGCGKSTLLRCMNRLNDLIDSVEIDGTVQIDGEDIYSPGYDVSCWLRFMRLSGNLWAI